MNAGTDLAARALLLALTTVVTVAGWFLLHRHGFAVPALPKVAGR